MTEQHDAMTASIERAALARAIEDIRKDQADMRAEQADMRADLKKNTEVTSNISAMTKEMVDLFAAAKGTFKVMGWIGKGITWCAGIAAALGAMWLVFKGGFPPRS